MFVITGGGSGLGRALALELSKRHQSVLIVGRHVSTLQETAEQSAAIQYCCADVSSAVGRAMLVDQLAERREVFGLIHNAGTIDPIVPLSHISEAEWRTCMATNVDAPLFLTQSLLTKLTQGRILHIGSGAAYFPVQGWGAYCTSKAALAMLTRCWQIESKVSIASVMPGIIDTPMQNAIRHAQHMDPSKQDFFCQLKQTQRLLSPEVVATFLTWLLLDITPEHYVSQEWDIYDTTHHAAWLRAPHEVPSIN